MGYLPKINTKRDLRCLELTTYVTAEGGSRLRATLRFAQRRSESKAVLKPIVSLNFHRTIC